MGTLRKLERQVIRNQCYLRDGNTKAFKEEWDKHHYKRNEEVDANGNVKSVRKRKSSKKKQRHHDNGKLLIKQLKAMKSFISNMKDKSKNKNEAKSKEN